MEIFLLLLISVLFYHHFISGLSKQPRLLINSISIIFIISIPFYLAIGLMPIYFVVR